MKKVEYEYEVLFEKLNELTCGKWFSSEQEGKLEYEGELKTRINGIDKVIRIHKQLDFENLGTKLFTEIDQEFGAITLDIPDVGAIVFEHNGLELMYSRFEQDLDDWVKFVGSYHFDGKDESDDIVFDIIKVPTWDSDPENELPLCICNIEYQ